MLHKHVRSHRYTFKSIKTSTQIKFSLERGMLVAKNLNTLRESLKRYGNVMDYGSVKGTTVKKKQIPKVPTCVMK